MNFQTNPADAGNQAIDQHHDKLISLLCDYVRAHFTNNGGVKAQREIINRIDEIRAHKQPVGCAATLKEPIWLSELKHVRGCSASMNSSYCNCGLVALRHAFTNYKTSCITWM